MKWCTRGVVTKFFAYLQFELQPVNSIIPSAKVHIQQQAMASEIEYLESCFDDLRNTQALAMAYLEDKEDDDVEEFCSEVNKLQRKFKEAIKTINSVDGPVKIKECTEAYTKALDDEGGHADENNDGDRGKSTERAMFKVWYSFLSMSLL